ncbi:MAG: PDZ domain-containing protein [Lentisphaerae bacterium]|nr:PDZ domain-containing protein [Lentisphaerota bacterium]
METFLYYLEIAGAVVFVFFAIGFCIFSHEMGHFLAGKMMGLHIDAFSLGFRPFWRKKYKGVEYRLGWLPFGGYVELPQIDASDEIPKSADGRELPRASALARIITAAAGPLFNIISGLLIACIVWAAGIPQMTPKMKEITVQTVAETSPEYAAGLRPGDVIVKVNGKKFYGTWQKFVETILYTIDEVTLDVRRDGKVMQITYLPKPNPDAPGQAGKEGIAYPFFEPVIPVKLYPESGSPAQKAGVKAGDLVQKINGVAIKNHEEFATLLSFCEGKPVTLQLLRDGNTVTLNCTPELIENGKKFERYLIGIRFKNTAEPHIAAVMPGGSADTAGLRAGDLIKSADGKTVNTVKEFQELVAAKKSTPFELTVIRDGKELKFTLTASHSLPYHLGSALFYDHPDPFEQFANVLSMSWHSLRGIVTTVGNKLHLTESQSSLKPSHMSGPLGIGVVLFNSIRVSWVQGIYFVVVISFALAIFNLLPLPVLDGGHIVFGLIELIFRKPVPASVVKVLSYIFITLLLMLMVFVTFSDGKRVVNQVSSSTESR